MRGEGCARMGKRTRRPSSRTSSGEASCGDLKEDVAIQQNAMAHDEDLFIIRTGPTRMPSERKQHEKHLETALGSLFRAERAEARGL
jgi:hypothetical protein